MSECREDFVEISRPLLALPGEPRELLYPAERIHKLLLAAEASETTWIPAFAGMTECGRLEEPD